MRMTDLICQTIGAARRKPSSGLSPFLIIDERVEQCLLAEGCVPSANGKLLGCFLGWPIVAIHGNPAFVNCWLIMHRQGILDLSGRHEVFIFTEKQ